MSIGVQDQPDHHGETLLKHTHTHTTYTPTTYYTHTQTHTHTPHTHIHTHATHRHTDTYTHPKTETTVKTLSHPIWTICTRITNHVHCKNVKAKRKTEADVTGPLNV